MGGVALMKNASSTIPILSTAGGAVTVSKDFKSNQWTLVKVGRDSDIRRLLGLLITSALHQLEAARNQRFYCPELFRAINVDSRHPKYCGCGFNVESMRQLPCLFYRHPRRHALALTSREEPNEPLRAC